MDTYAKEYTKEISNLIPKQVQPNLMLSNIFTSDNYPENSFDTLVLVFAHFPYAIRKKYHKKLVSYLKPNGIIIFEAFGKEQLNFQSGGPKQLDMLFSEDEIKEEFLGINFSYLATVETTLDEGPYHQGKGNVVRFIGQKI
jgi:hypothetical protein